MLICGLFTLHFLLALHGTFLSGICACTLLLSFMFFYFINIKNCQEKSLLSVFCRSYQVFTSCVWGKVLFSIMLVWWHVKTFCTQERFSCPDTKLCLITTVNYGCDNKKLVKKKNVVLLGTICISYYPISYHLRLHFTHCLN